MPPSRRWLLRTSALSLATFGGCSMLGDSAPADDTPTEQSPSQETESTERTATTDTPTSPACGPGPLPDAGWPLPERSVGRTNYAPTANGPTERPSPEWTVEASKPEWGEVRFTRPVVADGMAYVGRRVLVGTEVESPDQQYVHAYDTVTGERQWRAPVAGTPRVPAVSDGTVFAHDDSTLYALDAATGTEQWTYDPDGTVSSVLPIPDGVLVASTRAETDDTVLDLLRDGNDEWRVSVPEWLDSELAWVASRAYLATTEATLVSIDTDAAEIDWTRDLGDRGNTVFDSLAVTPCAVFVAVDSTLYAVRRDGDLAWSIDSDLRDLATDGERIYAGTATGHVRTLASADGEQEWKRYHGVEEERHRVGFHGLAVDAATIYAGTQDGKLLAVGKADGSRQWVIDHDWGTAEVAPVGDTLYTAWGRRLLAYR